MPDLYEGSQGLSSTREASRGVILVLKSGPGPARQVIRFAFPNAFSATAFVALGLSHKLKSSTLTGKMSAETDWQSHLPEYSQDGWFKFVWAFGPIQFGNTVQDIWAITTKSGNLNLEYLLPNHSDYSPANQHY